MLALDWWPLASRRSKLSGSTLGHVVNDTVPDLKQIMAKFVGAPGRQCPFQLIFLARLRDSEIASSARFRHATARPGTGSPAVQAFCVLRLGRSRCGSLSRVRFPSPPL
jgi:hypothetical protein